MTLRAIEYRADGAALEGILADGSEGRPAPGALVAQEAPGLTEHAKGRALALDLDGAHDLDLEEARRRSVSGERGRRLAPRRSFPLIRPLLELSDTRPVLLPG